MSDSVDTWTTFRDEMPVCERWAYFDHAAVAPLSGPARRMMARWLDDAAANGAVNWSAWRKRVERTRRLAAEMLNAPHSDIAIVRNTTEGIGLVAEGYPWREGDNVVVFGGEFPSNLYPWLNLKSRSVEVRVVDEPNPVRRLDAALSAADSRTRIVAVSWVDYSNGWRQPLDQWSERIHATGALLFVDAIQGLGVFPLDVEAARVDFLAADGHKWLLGPEGAGILYIANEHLDRLRPLGIGWNSVAHAGDYSNPSLVLRSGAARYEGGTYNMPGVAGLGASLELLAEFGSEALSDRLVNVVEEIQRRLVSCGATLASPADRSWMSGIISAQFGDRDPHQLRRHCADRDVVVNCRAGRLRISPHSYTSGDDVARLMGALAGTG